jgi:hypothetical protein
MCFEYTLQVGCCQEGSGIDQGLCKVGGCATLDQSAHHESNQAPPKGFGQTGFVIASSQDWSSVMAIEGGQRAYWQSGSVTFQEVLTRPALDRASGLAVCYG